MISQYSIYLIIWSVLAIVLGVYSVFFRKSFINTNIKFALFLYKITRFPLYKFTADRMRKQDSLEWLSVMGGLIFIYLGVSTIWGLVSNVWNI